MTSISTSPKTNCSAEQNTHRHAHLHFLKTEMWPQTPCNIQPPFSDRPPLSVIKSPGRSFWFLLLFLPIVGLLSVAFLSQRCLISPGLATYHSISPDTPLSIFPFSFLFFIFPPTPICSALFNQKLFQPLGSVSKYNEANWHTRGRKTKPKDNASRLPFPNQQTFW